MDFLVLSSVLVTVLSNPFLVDTLSIMYSVLPYFLKAS